MMSGETNKKRRGEERRGEERRGEERRGKGRGGEERRGEDLPLPHPLPHPLPQPGCTARSASVHVLDSHTRHHCCHNSEAGPE